MFELLKAKNKPFPKMQRERANRKMEEENTRMRVELQKHEIQAIILRRNSNTTADNAAT